MLGEEEAGVDCVGGPVEGYAEGGFGAGGLARHFALGTFWLLCALRCCSWLDVGILCLREYQLNETIGRKK